MRVGVRLLLGASVLVVLAAGICVACVGDSSGTADTPQDGGAGQDVSTTPIDSGGTPVDSGIKDAGSSVPCSQLPWPSTGSVGVVANVSTTFNELNVSLTADALTLFLSRGTGNSVSVFESIRDASSNFPQDTQVVDIVSSTNGAMLPNVSADGLTMYVQYRANGDGGVMPEGGLGAADAAADATFNLYMYTRATTTAPWVGPTFISGVNTAANESQPFISADGNTLYFVSDRTTQGVFAMYQAAKTSPGVFGNVAEIKGLATAGASVGFPVMSADGTTLYYSAPTGGAVTGETDIYMVTRANPNATFGNPMVITQLSTPTDDRPGFISADECRFYFTTKTGSSTGDFDVWISKKR